MAQLEISGLEKQYGAGPGAVVALAPVDLSVETGEVVAIVGPSGCGKTTLLRAVAGLTPPSGGQVEIDGNDVWASGGAAREPLRRVSMVFQEPNLLPWLSIEENVALPLRVRGEARRPRRAKAAELCALVGIAGFEKRRPDELSIGMRQRAALARALAAEPSLLLLDEPFAALDAITRDTMNLELAELWSARPVTALLVTHSIGEAVFLADRVVLLTARPGRVASVTAVDLPRPRAADVQHTAAFQHLVRDLRAQMAAVA